MILRPRDTLIFEAIQRHGPLPTHYLYEFSKAAAKDYTGFQKRLVALFRAGLLDRPQTLNNPLIKTDFKVYVLTKKSEEVLATVGKRDRFASPVGGGYQHAFMASCITANIEIDVASAGLEYISQEQILARHTCPAETRTAEKPLAIETSISWTFTRTNGIKHTVHSGRPTEPDQLFGVNYGPGYRFFAIEADRGTEPLTRQNLSENSILRKLLAYQNIVITGAAKKRFGIPHLYPTFITTSEERVENIIVLAKEIYPDGAANLLFKAVPGFHVYFRTPARLPQLFTEPYKRAGHEALAINKG